MIYAEILVENHRFVPTPPQPFFGAPVWVTPLEFCLDLWRQKTRVPVLSYGVLRVILRLAILVQSRLVTDGQMDGQTDRQTHERSIYRASIASSSKTFGEHFSSNPRVL